MATTYAVANTGKKNNNGTVLNGGNVSSTGPLSNNLTLGKSAYSIQYGSRVPPANNPRVGTAPAPISGGTYAVMADGKYIARYISGNVIAGVSNTVLRGPASDYSRRPINKSEKARRYNIISWDYVTGAATKGGSAGASYNMVDPLVPGGSTASFDSAANPTFSVPGELVYMYGSVLPKQDDYKPRTST